MVSFPQPSEAITQHREPVNTEANKLALAIIPRRIRMAFSPLGNHGGIVGVSFELAGCLYVSIAFLAFFVTSSSLQDALVANEK